MRGIIIKDDKRYDYTESYLKEKGYILCDEDAPPKNLDFIIFPFLGAVDCATYDDSYFKALNSNTIIFSGVQNAYLSEICKRYDLRYYIMANAKSVQLKNAIPTSEGTIAHLITNRIDTVSGSRILVIGYGSCGSDLAKKLIGLGAHVSALIRNKEKENSARMDGVSPVYLDTISDVRNFDIVINTVPSRVLTNEMVDAMKALIIDISSKPYGFNTDKATILPGIPGKYAIRTAGYILGEYIETILRGK